jgi:hypothetical protein
VAEDAFSACGELGQLRGCFALSTLGGGVLRDAE